MQSSAAKTVQISPGIDTAYGLGPRLPRCEISDCSLRAHQLIIGSDATRAHAALGRAADGAHVPVPISVTGALVDRR